MRFTRESESRTYAGHSQVAREIAARPLTQLRDSHTLPPLQQQAG